MCRIIIFRYVYEEQYSVDCVETEENIAQDPHQIVYIRMTARYAEKWEDQSCNTEDRTG